MSTVNNKAEWVRLAASVIVAVLVGLGFDSGDASKQQLNSAATSNCEADNRTKALARELVALTPLDPDVTPAERRRFQTHVTRLTRPRDCARLVE